MSHISSVVGENLHRYCLSTVPVDAAVHSQRLSVSPTGDRPRQRRQRHSWAMSSKEEKDRSFQDRLRLRSSQTIYPAAGSSPSINASSIAPFNSARYRLPAPIANTGPSMITDRSYLHDKTPPTDICRPEQCGALSAAHPQQQRPWSSASFSRRCRRVRRLQETIRRAQRWDN